MCFVVSCLGDFGQEGTSRGSSSPPFNNTLSPGLLVGGGGWLVDGSFTNTLSPGLLVGDGGWLVDGCSTAEDVEQSVECLAVE